MAQPAAATSASTATSASVDATASAVTRAGALVASFDAGLAPNRLPRNRPAPVRLGLEGTFGSRDGSPTPALRTMRVDLVRGGRVNANGLPRCGLDDLEGTSSQGALRRCRGALVGRGGVDTEINFTDQPPDRNSARVLLFNARGAVLMHVYVTYPVRATFLVPIRIVRADPRRGMILAARFPQIAAGFGSLTGFRMTLNRRFMRGGERRSYLQASCAAPPAFDRLAFQLARVTYTFVGGDRLATSALGSCRVRNP